MSDLNQQPTDPDKKNEDQAVEKFIIITVWRNSATLEQGHTFFTAWLLLSCSIKVTGVWETVMH